MKKILLFFLLVQSVFSYAQLSDNALLFDSLDDRVIISNSSGAYSPYTGNFTIEAWIHDLAQTGAFSEENIFTTTDAFTSGGYRMSILYGNLTFFMNGHGGSIGAAELRDGMCHHVAVSRSGTTLSYFIDGIHLGDDYTTDTLSTTHDVWLGCKEEPFNNLAPLHGLLKEVRYWNIARTEADIQSTLNNVLPSNTPGLKGYWRCNDTTGQIVTDYSIYQNHGTRGSYMSADPEDPTNGILQNCPVATSVDYFVEAPVVEVINMNNEIRLIAHSKDNLLLSVFDLQGKIIFNSEFREHISFGENFESGVYIIRVGNGRSDRVLKIIR